MKEMSPGTALRQLQQAQAGLKKARQLLKQTRGGGPPNRPCCEAGWESLAQANRLMAEIPLAAADEAVMTKQLAVQRYATALLVRLRRLLRNEGSTPSSPTRTTVRRRGHRGLTAWRAERPPSRPAGPRPAPIVPDRSLTPDESLPTIAIRAAGSHPFVYRKMVEGPVGPAAPNHGDLVRVVDRDGLPLGFALYNGRSQITLRFLSRGRDAPGPSSGTAGSTRPPPCGSRSSASTRDRRLPRHPRRGDGLCGLIVDRFDDVLSVEVFSLGIYQRIGPILDLLADRLGTKHFRVNVDERIALPEDFPGRPLASPQLPPRVTIHEHGIRFRVHFGEGHKTGFFCDQRDNRRDLARFCAGRSVLDVCCYTGGFGLNALIRGEAREVTCVDLDEKAIALAKENGNANQVRPTPSTPTPSATCGRWARTGGPTAWSCSTRPS